ncbi:MAG: hypothetical protein MR569_08230 [Dialister sp.]|nr:hypothetical protein [Dialister sp.]
MRIVISSEVEKSSLQTDKGRAKVERGSTQVLFSWDDDTEKPYFQQVHDQPRLAALDCPFQRKGREW